MAERPRVAAASSSQTAIVQPHRDLGGEILELVAGQPELREDDQPRTLGARLVEQGVMGREVDLERPEPGRDLGEGDGQRLHSHEHTRSPCRDSASRRPGGADARLPQ